VTPAADEAPAEAKPDVESEPPQSADTPGPESPSLSEEPAAAAASEIADDEVIVPSPPQPVASEPVPLAETALIGASVDAKPKLAHMLRKSGRRKSKTLK
jgi:hypothetical protein